MCEEARTSPSGSNDSATGKLKVMGIIARMNIGGPASHVVLLAALLDPNRFESLLVSGLENPGEGSMLYFAAEHEVEPILIPEIVGQATLGPDCGVGAAERRKGAGLCCRFFA